MNERIRTAFVTQWYPPEPAMQPKWIAEALVRQGLEVEVLTGVPNYPNGVVQNGYSAWRGRTDMMDGLRVRRAPLYPSHDGSAARRMLNYVSWAVSSSVWGLQTLRKADVALVYSSPATAALPAMVAKRLFGTPYVLLIQDVWPDSIFASGFLPGLPGKVVQTMAKWFVNHTYRAAANVAVISPGMVDLLATRGVDRSKLTLIYNWVSEGAGSAAGTGELRDRLGIRDDDFVLMYAGNHGAAQALESVVEAFASPETPSRCHLVMVGDGVEKRGLQERAVALRATRVHFLEPVAHADIADLVADADAQLVCLAGRQLFEVTMPSKLQAILQAGKPALVAASGDAARIVEEAGAGVAVPPDDVKAVIVAVTQLSGLSPTELDLLGSAGRAYYAQHMSERVGANRLHDLLVRAAAKSLAVS